MSIPTNTGIGSGSGESPIGSGSGGKCTIGGGSGD